MSFSFSTALDRQAHTQHTHDSSFVSADACAVGDLQSREVRVVKDPEALPSRLHANNLFDDGQELKDASWPLKKRIAFDHKHIQKDPTFSHDGSVTIDRSVALETVHEDPHPAGSEKKMNKALKGKQAAVAASASTVEQEHHDTSDVEGTIQPLPQEFVIDRSRIKPIKVLGFGSFGHVYEAILSKSGAKDPLRVAIKVNKLFEDQEVHQDYMQALSSEAQILATLQRVDSSGQRAIARFISAGYVSERCFCLVQELYERDISYLMDHRQRPQRLSIKDISKIAFQLLDALRFLKQPQVNIIHCDLKPQNIFLENERDYRVRIGDFGSAKVGPQENPDGEYLITRWYRPPEVVFKRPFHFASDIWSLGCIMHEMFALRPLLPASDESHLLNMMYELLGSAPTSFITKIQDHQALFAPSVQYPGYFHLLQYTPDPRENRREVFNKRLSFDPSKVVDCFDTEKNYHLFKNFVQSMLTWDDTVRYTPEKLLAHPFICMLESKEFHVAAAGGAAAAELDCYFKAISLASHSFNCFSSSSTCDESFWTTSLGAFSQNSGEDSLILSPSF